MRHDASGKRTGGEGDRIRESNVGEDRYGIREFIKNKKTIVDYIVSFCFGGQVERIK
jgi:hypothetical protein